MAFGVFEELLPARRKFFQLARCQDADAKMGQDGPNWAEMAQNGKSPVLVMHHPSALSQR
jgi:hypothetical protein